MIQIFCDGACKGNPGEAGSGVIVYENNKVTKLYGKYQEKGTNNTAELIAFEIALRCAKKIDKPVQINIDSQYAMKSISEWAYSWKAKNWTKKGGIKNLELIKRIHELYDSIKDNITLNYVKGHSGIEGNEEADMLANKAIEEKTTNIKSIIIKD